MASLSRVSRGLTRSLKQPTTTLRSLSSSTAVPNLLASHRRVEAANDRASDELGDFMARRWLGAAAASGTDADRVRPPSP
jgi:N-acetyl-gamma-glutamyl-phosphate reductase/acetylglutamate kinase